MSKKRKKTGTSGVKGMATDSWEKLEQLFAARVAMVLNAMQIPTHDDVQDLADRVAQLTRAVEKLGGQAVAPASKVAVRDKPGKQAAAGKKRAKAGAGKKRAKTATRKKRAKTTRAGGKK